MIARNIGLIAASFTVLVAYAPVPAAHVIIAVTASVLAAAIAVVIDHRASLDVWSEPVTWNDRRVALRSLQRADESVLLFVQRGCGPCTEMLPAIEMWRRTLGSRLIVVSTTEDAIAGVPAVTNGGALAERLGAIGTPAAVVIDRAGAIRSSVRGRTAIEQLVAEQTASSTSQAVSRRSVLRTALGTAGAAVATVMAVTPARADHTGTLGSLPGGHELCGCPEGQTDCNGACKDTSSDHNNCGGCGASCPPGTRCENGACVTTCSPGHTDCGGTCVDLSRDRDHCGACGSTCPPGTICDGGACVTSCPPGTVDCGGSCADVATDVNHCGGCGNVCPANHVCQQGACVPA